MKLKTRILLTAPCLVALIVMTGTARANTISGSAYCNITTAPAGGPQTGSGSGFAISTPTLADLANVNSIGTSCATFTASSIDFATNSGPNSPSNTLGGFLNSYNAVVGPVNYENGYTAGSNFDGTLLVFTTSAYLVNGTTYTLSHDDGTNIYADGVLITPPGAANQTVAGVQNFLYTGATGNFDLTLIYNSNYLSPAVYKTDVANMAATPEPSSFVLLGSGLLGVAGLVRRRMGV